MMSFLHSEGAGFRDKHWEEAASDDTCKYFIAFTFNPMLLLVCASIDRFPHITATTSIVSITLPILQIMKRRILY
jgi:hypothetical protein